MLIEEWARNVAPADSEYAETLRSNHCKTSVHEWYEGNRPAVALPETGSRRDEIILARFRCGYTRVQQHVAGLTFNPIRPNVTKVSSTHNLACIGFHSSQLLQLKFFIV
ncbi:hypothetical protein TNCV_562631 [Trichonephila clavipes]|nr:hypothetical protein TNCV_562631 [Trichonephila clavipes]